MKREISLHIVFFVLGLALMHYWMKTETQCLVKIQKSGGDTHMIVGVIR